MSAVEAELQKSSLGTGRGRELDVVAVLGKGPDIGLGKIPGLGTGPDTGLGRELGDAERPGNGLRKQYRRSFFLCSCNASFCQSRNFLSQTCLRWTRGDTTLGTDLGVATSLDIEHSR